MNRRHASVVSTLVAFLLLMTGFITSSTQASATNIVSIPNDLDACNGVKPDVGLTKHEGGFEEGVYNTFGKSYPIILIHGMGGKGQGQWGDLDEPTDLAARINDISNAVVAIEFQYTSSPNKGDLTFPSHLQPLANAIDCIAQISAQNGGPGKVIVVGYSEGSALTHGAAIKKSTDGRRVIGNEIGQAVTVADARIAYPFPWPLQDRVWTYFYTPNFPNNITVHSIGGNIINGAKAGDGSYTHEQVTHSDGLVHTSDATSQSTNDAGGGTHVTSCFRIYPRYNVLLNLYLGTPDSPSCEHSNLLRDSEETEWDIIDAITAFVNAHCVSGEPSNSSASPTAANVPMVDKTSPAPSPTSPSNPGTPSTPGGTPSSDPTSASSSPSTTPPSGCVS